MVDDIAMPFKNWIRRILKDERYSGKHLFIYLFRILLFKLLIIVGEITLEAITRDLFPRTIIN